MTFRTVVIMSHPSGLEPIHRDSDGELVGYLSCECRDGGPVWIARALFGGELHGAALERLSLQPAGNAD